MENHGAFGDSPMVAGGSSQPDDMRERTRERMAREGIPVGSDDPAAQALGAPPLQLIAITDTTTGGASMTTTPFDFQAWEQDAEVRMLRANFMACAYNAAVNYGSGRAHKKMVGLVEAINWYERAEGRAKLDQLVAHGVIDGYKPCAAGCEVRPGGLFHVGGCENDFNHPVRKARQQRAQEVLPGGPDGHAGWRAASVSLVGEAPRGT